MSSKILEIKKICKSYGDFKVDNVSFQLNKGEVMGLIGKNGAGKTTILKAILGLISLDSGKIDVISKEKIGSVIGEHVYYEYLTIKDMSKIIAKFYKTWNWSLFEKYLRKFNLKDSKKIEELSKGMKVKFAIACALSHQAEFLILDEPTSGLDPSARNELLDELYELVNEEGVTILFTSHISTDIEKISDRITYIREGKLVFTMDKDQLMSKYNIIKGEKDELLKLKTDGYVTNIIKQGQKYVGLCNSKISNNKELIMEQAQLNDIIIHLDKEKYA